MPIPTINQRENTFIDEVRGQGESNARRIVARYANADLELAAVELCTYLRARGEQNNLFDRYRCAERALYPDFGAIGTNRNDDIRKVLCYWRALQDLNEGTSYEQGQELIVIALWQMQRDRNFLGDFFEDGRNVQDLPACPSGIMNKLAEVLNKKHPDVYIIADINEKILHYLKVLLAIELRLPYAVLINPDTNFYNHLEAAARSRIIANLKILLRNALTTKKADSLVDWLKEDILNAVSYCYDDGAPWPEHYLQAQIVDVLAKLANPMPVIPEKVWVARDPAQVQSFKLVFKELLPVPNNSTDILINGEYRTVHLGGAAGVLHGLNIPEWRRSQVQPPVATVMQAQATDQSLDANQADARRRQILRAQGFAV